MGQIKFTVPDEVEERFRKRAMETFGYERGSMSKAAEQALTQWADDVAEIDHLVLDDDPVAAIDGMLSHVDADAVELQERIGRMKAEDYREERDADDR